MGAMKRELERLANIVIYADAETIEREFEKVKGLHDDGPLALIAYAIETARYMSPLCECGADYHLELIKRFPKFVDEINAKAGADA